LPEKLESCSSGKRLNLLS